MTSPPGQSRSRVWTLGRWLIGFVLTILLSLTVRYARKWLELRQAAEEGQKALAAELAILEQRDPRWRWEQILEDRPASTAAANSINAMMQLGKLLGNWDLTAAELPEGAAGLLQYPTNVQLPADRLTRLRQILVAKWEPLAVALSLEKLPIGRAEIATCPDYLGGTQSPLLSECRRAVLLLEMDNERMLHDRLPTKVVTRIQIILRIGAGLSLEPVVMSQLVRIHVRALAARQVERMLSMLEASDEQLQLLAESFQEEQREDVLRCAIRGERARVHKLYVDLETGAVPLVEFLILSTGDPEFKADSSLRAFAAIYQYRLFEDHAHCLKLFGQMLNLTALPWDQQLDAWEVWRDNLNQSRPKLREEERCLLSGPLLATEPVLAQAAVRDQAVLGCVLAAVAAERFRLANQRWPKHLEELCPRYLPVVPLDPYATTPLRCRSEDDGLTIYSVGEDRLDDGGTEVQLYGQREPGMDLGIRVRDPELRGLPAEKEKGMNDQPRHAPGTSGLVDGPDPGGAPTD